MVAPTRIVDLRGDEQMPAWQTVIELDGVGAVDTWTLVGGLMVYAHARAAGLRSPRPTDDADFLVDLQLPTTSLAAVADTLLSLDFHLDRFVSKAYRYRHDDGRVIDVMIADHPSRYWLSRARVAGLDGFQAPAGQQAINRREVWDLRFGEDIHCNLGIPNVLGALVSKGAAWSVDRRDRGRHLQDAATLLAAAGDVSRLAYDTINTSDRQRLRLLEQQLHDPIHPAWLTLHGEEREQGRQNLQLISGEAGLT